MLILYHDFPSAGSLVAVLRLQRLVDEGRPVSIRGFDVLGLAGSLPATLEDLDDWKRHRDDAAALGWDLPRPRLHPTTLDAHLVGDLAEEHGLAAAWRLACYRAHWIDHANLGDRGTLLGLAGDIGLPVDEVRALLADREGRHRLRQRMLVHRGDGIGGVPVLDASGTFVSPHMTDEDLRILADL